MPNVLTHGLMANQTKQQMSESRILSAIKAHPNVYLFGSNGPDFLFYHNVWPWLDQDKAKQVGDIGELMHDENINDMVDTMIKIAKKQTVKDYQDIMIAYIAGYLCHWALDSVTHPFVFYRSGDSTGDTKYDHYRYESALDSKVVQLVYQEKLSKYPTNKFMNMKKYQEKVIAFLVSHAVAHVYEIPLSEEDCLLSMKHAKQVLRVLFDPHTIWFDAMQIIERLIFKDKWKFSSHMVIGRMDLNFDELNTNQEVWYNPTDPSTPHRDSFMALFEQSIGRAKLSMIAFEKMLLDENDSLGNVILDRSFNTGRSDGAKMLIFDSIYQ